MTDEQTDKQPEPERCGTGWGSIPTHPDWAMHECTQPAGHGGPCACHCGAVRFERTEGAGA